jgi:hypothetical protein
MRTASSYAHRHHRHQDRHQLQAPNPALSSMHHCCGSIMHALLWLQQRRQQQRAPVVSHQNVVLSHAPVTGTWEISYHAAMAHFPEMVGGWSLVKASRTTRQRGMQGLAGATIGRSRALEAAPRLLHCQRCQCVILIWYVSMLPLRTRAVR